MQAPRVYVVLDWKESVPKKQDYPTNRDNQHPPASKFSQFGRPLRAIGARKIKISKYLFIYPLWFSQFSLTMGEEWVLFEQQEGAAQDA